MYVRKFEAESLDEALSNIKRELGPDAIILKTTTNKGLKGAFSKNKIEITAAISEKNYTDKLNVDNVLSSDQANSFYKDNAKNISKTIQNYNQTSLGPAGYGKAGLNRNVQTTSIENFSKPSLDDFLDAPSEAIEEKSDIHFEQQRSAMVESREPIVEERGIQAKKEREPIAEVPTPAISEKMSSEIEQKILGLEEKLFGLKSELDKVSKREAVGIFQLRQNLSSLDISPKFISNLIKNALFELATDDLENVDIVFDFALREMHKKINTEMPKFSLIDNQGEIGPVMFISDTTCGQSTMIEKIVSMRKDGVIICVESISNNKKKVADTILEIEKIYVQSLAEAISESRKQTESGKVVFIDLKTTRMDNDAVKKFIEGVKRSFVNVEVLVSLSAIHSEVYNRKVLNKYKSLADGMVVSGIDMCLNFGSLFNIFETFGKVPVKFFGTGEVIPDDIESATAERVLAGLFEL